ncbi:MAG: hypothetical protein ACYS19_06910 [Planctomycetota bacterium]|jgi:hypothetical protein
MLYEVLFCQKVFATPVGTGVAGFSGGTFDEESEIVYLGLRIRV